MDRSEVPGPIRACRCGERRFAGPILRVLALILSLGSGLVACGSVATPTARPVAATATSSPGPIPPPTVTSAPLPSEEPVVPAPGPGAPALESVPADGSCVTLNEAITITSEVFRQPRFEEAIATYLNEGGSVDALATSLASTGSAPEPILLQVVSQDVTASGLPELLLAVTIPYGGGLGETHVLFFTCEGGRYAQQILFRRAGAGSRAEGLYEGGGARVESLRDLNGSGMPDVVLSVNWPGVAEVYLLEWDGAQFSSLIEVEDLLGNTRHWIEAFGGQVEIVDVDGDGLYEIVVGEQGGEGTVIWRWDGERYSHDGDLNRNPVPEQGLDATWLVLSELGDDFLQLAASPLGSVWAISRDSLLQFDGQVWHVYDLPADLT
jgi:hypothetical protein